MRDHEVFETFCQYCKRKFERISMAQALKAAEEHESECGKGNSNAKSK